MADQDIFTNIITHDFLLSDELNSENFYKHLNHLEILEECSSYCETLREKGLAVRAKNICARTLSYLKSKYSTIYNQNDEFDACTLLNYWLYNRLYMLYGYKNDTTFVHAFGHIQRIWSDFIHEGLNKHNPKICNPIFDIAIQRDWKERKKLLDYCNNAKHLLIIANSHSGACNKYYQYIESKSDLYKQYEQACSSGKENMCPDFFNSCEVYDPVKVLPTLPCHPEMEKTKDVALEIPIRDDRGDPESRVGETDPEVVPQLQRENTPTVNKAGNVLLGVVITSMTSGALYRFTPLGGMIRNGLGWNTNNMRNFNGDDIRLYDYASGPFNPYPGEEHYIGYHPA
ncbi:PIR protein [Plasmodium vivax]|uniref:VIR protein n=1 Tax=Plasmodium vivax TaxID=5855 RepID=A0A565A5J8_PLAVI|nr:PIR protein [Plasmodium vivax]